MGKVIQLTLDGNGDLQPTNRGNVKLDIIVGRKVSWKIKDPDPGIESFRIAEKESNGDYHPFEEYPNPQHGRGQELRVRFLTSPGEWKYSIYWKKPGDVKERCYDPVISIKPVPLHDSLINIIFILLGAIFSIFTLKFLFGTKSKK